MRIAGVFFAVLAAIAVAVFFFAPEHLPAGVGMKLVPFEVTRRASILGKGQVAIIHNPSGATLHNVKIVCGNSKLNQQKVYLEENWEPNRTIELGWEQGWQFVPGETLQISASGYLPKTWNFD